MAAFEPVSGEAQSAHDKKAGGDQRISAFRGAAAFGIAIVIRVRRNIVFTRFEVHASSGHVGGQRGFELRVLRMRAHFAAIFRVAGKFQLRGAAIGLVIGNGDGGQFILAVRQGETITERAVRAQFDDAPADGDLRVRFRRAVKNQLGVDVEPEAFLAFPAAERAGKTGKAGDAADGRSGQRELRRP